MRRLLGNEASVPAPREFAPIAIREIELAAPLEPIPATTPDGFVSIPRHTSVGMHAGAR